MIPEYQLLIAGLIGGTGIGLLIGCVLGWILRRWKQEGDELVRQAQEQSKARQRFAGVIRGLRPDLVIFDDPLGPCHSGEKVLVDLDELRLLCDRVLMPMFWKDGTDSDAVVRARQMLKKLEGLE